LVAANGGGIQASAWTAKVLRELMRICQEEVDKENPERCARSIALVSSVSGGSVGTMFFVNAYNKDGTLSNEKMENAVRLSQSSSLDYVASGLVYADVVRNFPGLGYWLPNDRGSALEKSWLDNALKIDQDPDTVNGLRKSSLLSWRDDARNRNRPAVIFNSTEVETGERIIFSTSDIKEFYATGDLCNPKPSPDDVCERKCSKLFKGWKSFHKLFPGKDLNIRTAARLSASYPFVSPASNMRGYRANSYEGRHFVDGGFNENYGISSMIDWLDEGLCPRLKNKNTPPIMIVQIIGEEVFMESKVNNLGGGWFDQLLAPAQTVLGIRNTVQLSRNETEIDLFLRYWNGQDIWRNNNIKMGRSVFEYQVTKETEAAPLSWHMTKDQKDNIETVWTQASTGGKNVEALSVFRKFITSAIEKPAL
jgi:hypothetical protein